MEQSKAKIVAIRLVMVLVALGVVVTCQEKRNKERESQQQLAPGKDPSVSAPVTAPKPQQEQETAEDKVVQESRLEACREKLKAAAKLNLLADMSFDNGIPRVVVGRTWYTIDFSAKSGLAETCACFFLAGDTSKAIRFEIKDKTTNKTVAVWDYTRLKVE